MEVHQNLSQPKTLIPPGKPGEHLSLTFVGRLKNNDADADVCTTKLWVVGSSPIRYARVPVAQLVEQKSRPLITFCRVLIRIKARMLDWEYINSNDEVWVRAPSGSLVSR